MEQTTGIPFNTAEEAWLWFIAAQEARYSGARIVAGVGRNPRPCEPVDVLTVLDRLYRNRHLDRNHLMVLRHYGRRGKAPLPDRVKERRAAHIWAEAMAILEEPLIKKGIVEKAAVNDLDDDMLSLDHSFLFDSDAEFRSYARQADLFKQEQ